MNIKKLSLGPLGTNCYILYKNFEAIIVDPGGEAEKIISFMDEENIKPLCILLTHAHYDHMGGVDKLRTFYGIDVHLHENESDWLGNANLNGSLYLNGEGYSTKAPDCLIQPGKMNLGSFEFNVVHTPGHSPGSVTFVFDDEKLIISGDILFHNGVGRTDLLGGSFSQLEHSLREKIYQLPDDYAVLPGHGEKTSIGREKQMNPFISV